MTYRMEAQQPSNLRLSEITAHPAHIGSTSNESVRLTVSFMKSSSPDPGAGPGRRS
jgi:hypothetical protein